MRGMTKEYYKAYWRWRDPADELPDDYKLCMLDLGYKEIPGWLTEEDIWDGLNYKDQEVKRWKYVMT